MSTNVAKSSIRLYLPCLDGKSHGEALEYFKNKIGDTDDVDQYDGKVFYFTYDDADHPFRPVSDGNYWGVEIILSEERDYENPDLNISITTLQDQIQNLLDKFAEDANPDNISVHGYVWYNGTDEPIVFPNANGTTNS